MAVGRVVYRFADIWMSDCFVSVILWRLSLAFFVVDLTRDGRKHNITRAKAHVIFCCSLFALLLFMYLSSIIEKLLHSEHNYNLTYAWERNGSGVRLAINRGRSRRGRVTTPRNLFTFLYFSHQAVYFGTGWLAVTLCGWEGHRGSGIALASVIYTPA